MTPEDLRKWRRFMESFKEFIVGISVMPLWRLNRCAGWPALTASSARLVPSNWAREGSDGGGKEHIQKRRERRKCLETESTRADVVKRDARNAG
jgi:hypothetical protein